MEMTITMPGGGRVDARAGTMVIETNQDDTAPAPFALFLASLGTCAGIYVAGFCQKRGIPHDEIRIVQRMKAHPVTHMITDVELDIQLPADFPEKYVDAVIRAADQCAVKKHLEQPPRFAVHTSTLTDAASVPVAEEAIA